MHFLLMLSLFCCAGPPSPLNHNNVTDYVVIFVGKIIKVETTEQYDRVYSLEVLEAFKGVKRGDIINIHSMGGSTAVYAGAGEKWLMVPNYKSLNIDICGSSGILSKKKCKKRFKISEKTYISVNTVIYFK